MTSPGATLPTLSQVRAWDTAHLADAAGHWTATATVWEDVFTKLAASANNPGGVPWEGRAAEAAQSRAHSDRMTVIGLADQLHDAAAIARAGAWEIAEARRRALRLVDAAQEAGFVVGEDFSVTDTRFHDRLTAMGRRSRAEGLAAKLRAAVRVLAAADNRIAGELTAATAGMGGEVFADAVDESGVATGGAAVPPADLATGPGRPPPPAVPGAGTAGGPLRMPSKSDLFMVAAAGVGGASAEYWARKTREAIKAVPGTGAGRADPWVEKLVEEVTVFGKRIPDVTRMGGVAGAAMAVPSVIKDVAEDGNSVPEAIAREGVGLAVGALAGGLVGSLIPVPVVGTALGVAAGGLVGGVFSDLVDAAWEPAADAVGQAANSLASVFGQGQGAGG